MKPTYFLLWLFLASLNLNAQQRFQLLSPDGKLKISIVAGQKITYAINHVEDTIIMPSPISMQLNNKRSFGVGSTLKQTFRRTKNEPIKSPFYKRSQITDHYNELELKFKENFSLLFRAYNQGMAYRFVSQEKNDFVVENEVATFNFNKDLSAYIPYTRKNVNTIEAQFFNTFENTYSYQTLSKWKPGQLSLLPMAVEAANGKKICITEADLEDYPGMYLLKEDGMNALKGVYANLPKKEEQGGHGYLQMLVKERESYIARCKGKRLFPWRLIAVASDDMELTNNDLVYTLAAPSRVADVSWIKPGKAVWDWWSDWNLYGVNFKAGINNETYKYYIDFAAAAGIEYLVIDEGWAVNRKADLFQVVPQLDLKALAKYAFQKKVSLILWAGYQAFNKDMEEVCKVYSEMGIKGFKIDFMDRDDQIISNFYYRAAQTAAKYHLLLDFHGAAKPAGLNRTYPNVINFEGVHGLEQMKFTDNSIDQVTYDVTMPFIRQLAGPVDYTQGAMRNAVGKNYRGVFSEPMSQGTRCRQLAQYVVFESPLSMLCDAPTAYQREQECMRFISSVPTVWDKTVPLSGKIAQYLVMARQKGKDWFIGGMTNWEARTVELDLSFLGTGQYEAEVFKDGINADRVGVDYQREVVPVTANRKLSIMMQPGGGFAVRVYPK